MQLGMIGLGRMGGNIVRRLMQHGHTSVVYDVNPENVEQLATEGATPSKSLSHLVEQMPKPRAVWVMLPAGDINFAPEQAALVNLPVYFWTQTPTRFTALVPILDVVVYVNLTPTFTWSFGDNGFFVTTTQGAPFPIGGITHTYKNSDDYEVNLKVIWRGTWSVNGVTTPVSGNGITQSITRSLAVVKGPTKFIK